MMGVYMIENNVNGMVYIGKSKHLEKRIRVHMTSFRAGYNSSKLMQEDYDRYGAESFTFMILRECEKEEELRIYEDTYIKFFKKYNVAPIYNITKRKSPCKRPKIEIKEKL